MGGHRPRRHGASRVQGAGFAGAMPEERSPSDRGGCRRAWKHPRSLSKIVYSSGNRRGVHGRLSRAARRVAQRQGRRSRPSRGRNRGSTVPSAEREGAKEAARGIARQPQPPSRSATQATQATRLSANSATMNTHPRLTVSNVCGTETCPMPSAERSAHERPLAVEPRVSALSFEH